MLLRVKLEGAEKLKQTDAALKQTATSAKAAASALKDVTKATSDSKQMAFNFETPSGEQLGFFFDKDALQGLPPVLTQVAAKTAVAAKSGGMFAQAMNRMTQAQQGASGAGGQLVSNMKTLSSWAGSTALKIDLVAASLLFLVDTAMKASAHLERFTLGTGISAGGLLRAQGAGVRAGIAPEEMTQFVTSLQSAGAQMQMTGAGVGPWSLLSGILGVPADPRGDPIKLIGQLHEGIMKLRPDQLAIARTTAGLAGIPENMFAAFRNPEFDVNLFNKMYDVVNRNLGSMNKLNAEWNSLTFNIGATKNAFVGELAPGLTFVTRMLEGVLKVVGAFVAWLDRGSIAAQGVKVVLFAMAAALGVVAIAVSGVALTLTGLIPILIAVNAGMLPILGTVLLIAGAVAGVAAAVVVLDKVRRQMDGLDKSGSNAQRGFPRIGLGAVEAYGATFGGLGSFFGANGAVDLFKGVRDLFTHPAAGGVSNATSQTNTFHINEAGNPQRSARAVVDAQKQMLSSAAYSQPAPAR